MKGEEFIKDFSNMLMDVLNRIRLYGKNLPGAKVVENFMINVPQRFEAKISAIEESCNMTSLTIADFVSKLEAQEQRVSMRAIEASEGAFLVAHKGVKFNNSLKKAESSNKSKCVFPSTGGLNGNFPPCPIYLPMLNTSNDKCDSCQLGKSHRLPFSLDGVKRANMKLELVRFDLCGPMKTSFMNDNKYFVLFIDDLTRMCWVHFSKSKLNVLSTFKEFKIFVENQSNCKLKVLRTDNDGEYVSNEFNDFYRDSGIIHQLTIPRTPQQNGVCERRNQTVLEMARCTLFEKHLPKLFWAEAVATVVYLLNMLATKVVKHLRSKKVVVSRDVIFDEDSYWNWEKNDV
ncbi:hypothetical protein GQ457_17G009640 [Hibiscus cannabinus]